MRRLWFDFRPAALFAVGLTASHTIIKKAYLREILEISALKLLLQPLVAFLILWVMPTNMRFGVSALVLCALPSGAFVYILAQEKGFYKAESAAIVIGCTILSLITLPFVFILCAKLWPGLT